MKREPKELKDKVRNLLGGLLDEGAEEPPPWKVQALKHAITFLAVEAKLEEAEYGGFFDGADTDGVPERPREKPATRRSKRDTLSAKSAGSDDDPGSGTVQ